MGDYLDFLEGDRQGRLTRLDEVEDLSLDASLDGLQREGRLATA